MSYKTKCRSCGKTITSQRSSKAYCGVNCRVNHHQKKKRLEQKVWSTQQKIEETNLAISLEESLLGESQEKLQNFQSQLKSTQQDIVYCQEVLQKDLVSFYRDHVTLSKIEPAKINNWLGAGLAVGALLLAPKECQQKIQYFKTSLQNHLMSQIKVEGLIKLQLGQVKSYQGSIDEKERQKQKLLSQLRKLTVSLQGIDELQAENEKTHRRSFKAEGVGAQDFLHKQFNTFRLEGKLGTFLGEMDRDKLFITLKGDPGSGKSTLTMGIAQKFDQAGYKVIFYSLELGESKPLQDMLRRYLCSNHFRIVSQGDIHSVRKSAQQYDVVMIDSFGKLNCKAEELDKLRLDFPKTIFLSIVQKTTTGTSRGGAAIDFDSSIVINVSKKEDTDEGQIKRIAYMEKSRYGTQDWKYYIDCDAYQSV